MVRFCSSHGEVAACLCVCIRCAGAKMVWSEQGWLGDPTNLLLGKHHLFTQISPFPTP